MNEVGLILQPSTQVGEHQLFCYTNAKGQEKVDIQVWGEMAYTWINADEPTEKEVVSWAYYGQQDDISKVPFKYDSGTYVWKIYLLKYFGLPTDDDDPDAKDTTGKKPQTTAKQGNLSDAQIKRLYAIATKAGITKEKVSEQIKKKFNKDSVSDLTKAEYDAVCNGYENKAKEKEINE